MSSILSIGIDVGTSTTQVIFSRIVIDNTAGYFSAPRISIVDQEVFYRSKIHFTPLKNTYLLDAEAVRGIVESEFKNAGFFPKDVDTGAAIITGESARKENAELVLNRLSDLAGEFVVSTAGPDLESVIAGKGSGAYAFSMENECTVANLDVGGGTTNIVLFDSGETREKCCFDIGGRLIRLKDDFEVRSVSPSAERIAQEVGVPLREGCRTTPEELRRVTDRMASLLAEAVGFLPKTPLLEAVRTSKSSPLLLQKPAAKVCFSGGVADCMGAFPADEPLRFGDIGFFLGRSLRECPCFTDKNTIPAKETIRATVIGAGTYTTSLSGSTILYSEGIFPVKSVPVFKLSEEEEQAALDGRSAVLADRIRWFLEQSDSGNLILAMKGRENPTYPQLKRLAGCIIQACDVALPAEKPILVVTERDIAKALGIAMRSAAGKKRRIASIDGIHVEENDFLDIGRPLMDGLVVPVIVKTLLFG